jgi:hypothetical protein
MTMRELPIFVTFILVTLGFALALAAILMPIVVIIIDGRLAKVAKTLAAMEDMMRKGR